MKFFDSHIGPSVFETYYRHAAKALETVEHMERCVTGACEDGDTAEAITATSNAELEADELKTELRGVMRGSIRLAISKEVFLDMISPQDRIADYAENVTEIISFRPGLPFIYQLPTTIPHQNAGSPTSRNVRASCARRPSSPRPSGTAKSSRSASVACWAALRCSKSARRPRPR